ncbi:MAG TPA: RidA family protein [Steroidobacteraceae bacterium]|nr:RidA family protein [Steroidobacteraceae bacterium]
MDTANEFQILKPASWPRPSGYSNGIAITVTGRQIFVAGQVGWDAECKFTSTQLADQVRQALQNICTVLAEAHAGPEHIVRLTWYLTSRDEYLADLDNIGTAYRDVMGKNFPVMSVVQVAALMEAQAKVEIEATAVIPDKTEAADSAAAEDTAEVEVFDIQLEDIVTPPSR